MAGFHEKNSGRVEKRCFAGNSFLALLIRLPRKVHTEPYAVWSRNNVKPFGSKVRPDPSSHSGWIPPHSTRWFIKPDSQVDGCGAHLERALP